MKNILGKEKDLKLYDAKDRLRYEFEVFKLSETYFKELTYNKNGQCTSFNDSDGEWSKSTYNKKGERCSFRQGNNKIED